MTADSANYLTELHHLLTQYFNLAEIRTLCLQLNVDYESVAGEEKPSRIRELLLALGRNGRLPQLVTLVQQQRPNVTWPLVPDAFEMPQSLTSGGSDMPVNQYHVDVEGSMVGAAIGDGASVNAEIIAGGNVTIGYTVEQVSVLIETIRREDQPIVWNGRTPYLGLTAFQESDAEFFFGRESLVDDLLERVQKANFIVIAGPSGSGKSSVARAGLFHALRSGRLTKSDSWLLATMQPKGDPLEQLALALERTTKSTQLGDAIRADGASNPALLQRQIEMYLTDDPRQRCVILVDQFEETFTQTKNDETRAAFINLLTTTIQTEDGRIVILLSLRSDFISHCARYPELRRLMSQQFQLVGAMDPPDLAKAITLPALEVGAGIDPALVSRIMADMKEEPGALPLMSFALRDLFEVEKSTKGQPMDLTLPEYLKRGGIESALERHANKVFDEFTGEQKALARGIFSKLIEVGQGRADTRRTAVFNELVPAGTEQDAVEAVVNVLAQESIRLITVDDEDGNRTVTIAHEKLIDAWPWLRQLVDENREMIALQSQIQNDAKTWHEKKDAGFLYRGGRLIQVEEQLNTASPDLNELSQKFIQASFDQRQQEIEKEAAQRRREREQAEQLKTALAEAQEQAVIARRQASVAQSRSLATTSLTVGHKNDMRALLLAIAAGQQAETTLAFTALQIRLPFMLRPLQTLSHSRGGVNGAAWNSDRSQILTWSDDQTAKIWEAASGKRLHALPHAGAVNGAAWNGDESKILTWTFAGTAVLWKLASDERLQILSHKNTVIGAAWNSDESQVLTWSKDGTAVVWEAASGERLQTLAHADEVNGAAWNGDESQILTWSDDGTAVVWEAASAQRLQTLSHEGTVNGAAWNNDESQILTWSGSHYGNSSAAVVWEAASGERLQTLSHADEVNGAAWNGDESQILTWSSPPFGYSGTAAVWEAASGKRLQTLSHEGSVNGAVWNDDESQILTWSGSQYGNSGTTAVWEAASGKRLQTLSHADEVNGAAWNGDESQILTWGQDGMATVWEAASGQRLQTLSHEDGVIGAAWNGDESQILTWSSVHSIPYGNSGTAIVWEAARGKRLQTLSHEDGIIGAALNRDESQILTWSDDGTAVLWDVVSGKPLQTFLIHEDVVIGGMWNGDESQILTWSRNLTANNGTVTLWEAASGKRLQTLPHERTVWGAVWSRDESQILTWSGNLTANNGTVTLWEAASGKRVQTFSHAGDVKGAVCNGDESQILTWGRDRMAAVWETASGKRLQTFSHQDEVEGAAWNRDESQILTWSRDGMAVAWEVASGERLQTFFPEGWVLGAAWNGDESRILTWGFNVILWEVASGERLQTLPHDNIVNGALWNRDESQILTWSQDRTAVVWGAARGERLQTLSHEDEVEGAVWNEDESQILTWSYDGTAKIWAAQTGQPLHIITPDGKKITAAKWNQNEKRLLVVTEGGIVRIYDTDMNELLMAACQLATRNFNWREWQLYFPGEPYRKICPELPVHPSVPQEAIQQ